MDELATFGYFFISFVSEHSIKLNYASFKLYAFSFLFSEQWINQMMVKEDPGLMSPLPQCNLHKRYPLKANFRI